MKLCALALICVVAGVCVAACGSTSTTSSSSNASVSGSSSDTAAQKIITAWPADITSLDPANLSTSEDHGLTHNIYQTLALPAFTTQKNGTLEVSGNDVTPYLAKSWNIGSSSITFHLRSGVKFYPSNDPLTATDVKFSLDRIFSTPGAGDLQSNGVQGSKDVIVVNPMTVRVNFTSTSGKPLPITSTELYVFSQQFTGVIDAKVALKHATSSDPAAANWLRLNAAGSGPYYIASRQPGVSMVLKPVPNSWLPAPDYKEIDIQISTGSIASLMQDGSINYADQGMTDQQVNSLGTAGKTVDWEDTGNFDMFAITSSPNSQVGPLGNLDVRKAIAYALPYNQVLNSVIDGRGQRAGSIVMPSAPEYTGAWLQYSTNITKAKSLMSAAGNPTVNEPLYYLQGDADQTDTAILIKASLKQIGVNATLTPETQEGLFNVVDARSQPPKGTKIGPPGLELFNWSGFSDDPSIVIGYWATKGGINNYSLYSDPTVNAINAQYAALPSSSARTAAYQKAQKLIADSVPYVPLVLTGATTVVNPGIDGVSFSPGGSDRYWTLHPSGTTDSIDSTLFK